ncbi:MAG TPA: hypothetical protein VKQ72_17465 [Aggregatilineales bacterium]|nr:hypothetical protein [Aggregatilineales bacterium]
MAQNRRKTTIWLALLGLAVLIAVLAGLLGTLGPAQATIAYLLGMVYVALALGTFVNLRLQDIRLSMPRLGGSVRTTPAARKAAQRAHLKGGLDADAFLTDVGLILNDRAADGQLRRHLAQVVALDEGAIQPFVTLNVLPEHSNRLAIIQFEVYDHTGKLRFSRQCDQWLRDGENLIVCDRQLSLQGSSTEGARSGVWDLRLTVDGVLVGMHGFSVTPSTAERRRRLSNDGEAGVEGRAAPEESPVSLEELLRQQRGSHRE